MSLPTSETGICNLAADLLKEKPISDITTPTTDVESIFARWYDIVRTDILSVRKPSFATKGEAIPRGGTPSPSIYADYYVFPNDFLQLVGIADPLKPLSRYDYRLEEGKILLDNSGGTSLNVWFVFDQDDVSTFPAPFIKYLAGRLATAVGHKITAKPAIMKMVSEFTTVAEKEFLAFNGQGQPPRRYERSRMVDTGLAPSASQQVAGDYEFDFTP